MSCRSVRDWLHRDSSELDEAQRLLLDDHLAGCDRCHGDRARLRQVRSIGASLDTGLEQRDYNRAIARALLEGAPRREPAPARRRWVFALAGLALAGAASAAVAIRASRSGSTEDVVTPRPVAPPPAPPRPARPQPVGEAREPAAIDVPGASIAKSAAVAAAETRTPARAGAPVPRAQGPSLAELLRQAETAQADGRLDVAIERYEQIASSFRAAPEAESSLYAAARLALRLGHGPRAKALLDDYLSRYPRGRYVDDARRELTTIR